MSRFEDVYFDGADQSDLSFLDPADRKGAARAHRELAAKRTPGTAAVRVSNPTRATDGWTSPHTVIEIVTHDMPFIVDSVSAFLARAGLDVYLLLHPVVDGESYVHLEIPRESDPTAHARLATALESVLADVRAAVTDWELMTDRVRAAADRLRRQPPPKGDPEETSEAVTFLEWLADDHFTFVGACDQAGGEPLGIARRRVPAGMPGVDGAPHALAITKALERSTVHRAVPLDVVAVKRIDEHGEVVGEDRFLGLYAADVYSDSVADVPVVRRRAAAVLARAGYVPRSHDHRALVHVLETFPRDELFRLSDDEVFSTAVAIMQLGERRRVRLFANRDPWGRFVSCLVYLPRDRYTTPVRVAVLDALRRAYHGTDVDFTALVGESVLAQLRVVVQTAGHVDVDDADVEDVLVDIARAWTDDLRDALVGARGEEAGLDAWNRWADAFPAAYQADVSPSDATGALEVLEAGNDLAIRVVRAPRASAIPRLEFYRVGEPLLLSDVMAVLEYLDVVVVDERPYTITPPGGAPRHVYSFGVRPASGDALAEPDVQPRLTELFLGVWAGTVENDALNRLVLRAGLAVREVVVLRALVKYLHQAGTRFTEGSFADALAANPRAAQLLVELFAARFDPSIASTARDQQSSALAVDLGREIDAVTSLDEDRILRGLLELVLALVRTNVYADPTADHLSIKVDPAKMTRLPPPRPRHEIWVYSPRVEGVHLRAGDIARGGIRWSDRRDDFRTEIFGLMKAQTEKNAVIVPVGAKGGFVVKSAPAATVTPAEVEACYRTFVGALLDLTDNLVDGRVVPPARVVRHDRDDPYLVVAADKGTARFSDVANTIAAEHGYWLGDAFASGGSTGYDHKAMGITSRGAWVSVRAHFRAMGVDADTAPLTVVGIGDMSGDVFGNGMLRSPHIKLVAAFDHRHVFIDPDPDSAASFRERARLFALPSSSWADYDPAVLSAGGGVYPRAAKACDLAPEARRALGLDPDVASLTPDDVVSAILRAPVDLLFNGGIGTFVKASTESHADVADRANDAIRVDAVDLRCKVVAEGGNLGFTQLARVEYALSFPAASRDGARGRVNTDAIDNSAGVDCSDHEVNIKILLRAAVASDRLSTSARNELLAAMTEEVAALVLADNEAQTNALEIAASEAYDFIGVHARQIDRLEQSGVIDRVLEDLPSAKALQERHAAGVGLTAPELAVLLAFTKLDLQRALLASDVTDDPYLGRELLAYFPSAVRQRFTDLIERHELRREIIATVIANAVVNRAGISYVSRLSDETGADLPRLARAHVAARDVFGMVDLWSAIDELDLRVPAATQDALFLAVRRVVERAARWLTRHGGALDLTRTVSHYRDAVQSLVDHAPELARGDAAVLFAASADRLRAVGVPVPLARRVAALEMSTDALPIAAVSEASGVAIDDVARVHFTLGARLRLDWLRARIAELPRGDRWQIEARAGLRDDVADVHHALTEAVLAATPRDADASGRVEQWIARNADATARAEGVLSDIETAATYDLATLGTARRELRDLVAVSRTA